MNKLQFTKCPLPLFHGTSTLFIDSIREFGLGGKNIIHDANVLEFAKKIYPLIRDNLQHDNKFSVFSDMVNQTPLYQHGQAYVSLSYNYCTTFAEQRKFGSELITYSLNYYEELLERKLISLDLLEKYPYLKQIRGLNPQKVIVKIKDIFFEDMLYVDGNELTENDLELIKGIAELEESSVKESYETGWEFRIKKPVSPQKIEFIYP